MECFRRFDIGVELIDVTKAVTVNYLNLLFNFVAVDVGFVKSEI